MAQEAMACKAKLDHVWNWKEMENGAEITVKVYDGLMAECGQNAEHVEDQLAAVVAKLQNSEKRSKAK